MIVIWVVNNESTMLLETCACFGSGLLIPPTNQHEELEELMDYGNTDVYMTISGIMVAGWWIQGICSKDMYIDVRRQCRDTCVRYGEQRGMEGERV